MSQLNPIIDTLKNRLIHWFTKIYPMARRWGHKFPGGVFPKYNKSLSLRQPLRTDFIPKQLILPLQQHKGEAALPCVKVGDLVKKNQLIAKADKGLSAPIHAPTSGTITAVEPRVLPHASGLAEMCIVITPDGKDTTLDNVLNVQQPPQTIAQLKQLIFDAGIVGMGGAGFPTFAKLPKKTGLAQHLIINGAECEPFITCDDLLMQTHPDEIIKGAQILADIFEIPNVLCGIEDNKPLAVKAMTRAAKGKNIKLAEVPTVYPMGGQKQLIQELLGLEVPSGQHTIDIGILMINVATCRAIYQAATFGQPLVSRFVTVSGLGMNKPFNINALLGTPFNELAELADPKVELDYPLIMGGPMMGFKVAQNDVPVIKTTNCILANPPEPVEEAMACIRCGECAEACPVSLLPQQLYWHAQAHEYDKAEELNLFDCIECGCCSFVCPSHIPLVQYYRHAKAELRQAAQLEQLTEQAKIRFEARTARLEREKQEREARLAAKKATVKQQAAQKAKLQSEQPTKPALSSSDETTKLSARERAIQAAKARQQAVANKTKQTSESTTTRPGDTAELSKDDKRQAAMQAAKDRAGANKAKQLEQTDKSTITRPGDSTERSKEDKRQAAMQAAQDRAAANKAKQLEQTDKSTTTRPGDTAELSKDDKRQAAMQAAKDRAAANKAKQLEQTDKSTTTRPGDSTELSKEDKRQAAMQAAKDRAAANKAKQLEQTDKSTTTRPGDTAELSKEDKRQAAMQAARDRAAQRKKQEQQN